MARHTMKSLAAENDALRSENITLRQALAHEVAMRKTERTTRVPDPTVAQRKVDMATARELAMRLRTTVKVGDM